ncbi:protein NPAT isoform X2 [Oncorhynchus kisutch]|uniref:Nuclear protein, ataxia-telangiectasia locus n=1 Tax=Oncorhynchus kisutch TaxID=8019 RepID=A0A8C7I0F0_ONCKI|nr:protein NPAT isoform X2 [Oncorhynchus kisutch]
MLLPSDIARLVLGYMQQEGLCSTSQAFIRESPNLKEYAEHSSDDATIPACVFSLFGKNLTTILNEYVAVKAKETIEETQIPVMMTSLWKKLDFTLNQIKSMQNSPAIIQNQRLRTRNGIVNMRGRQRALSSTQSPSSGFLSSSAQGVATPVCYSSQQTRPSSICGTQPQIQDGGRLLSNVNRESPLQITVPDNRLTTGPLSPGRRKWRRGGGSSGSGGTGRANMAASSLTAEPQSEEAVTENFPQMLIQNARERILNDKSLQEKLAENINKILASDVSPQALKASCSTMEPDQSIDEILGLQGEIHMSNDVIQDILQQTESDPAFQALFDLFDYGKSKTSEDTEQGAGNVSNTTTENGEPETRCIDGSPETGDPGTGPENSTCGQENRVIKSSQEPKSKKTRKSAPPVSSTSKATPGPSSRGLRRGAISTTPGLSSRGLRKGASSTTPGPSSKGVRRGDIATRPSARIDQLTAAASSAANDSDWVDSGSIFNPDVSGVDIDKPLNTPLDSIAPPDVFEPVRQESGTIPPASACNTPSSETRTVSAVKNILGNENTVGVDGRQVMDNQASLLNSSPSLSNSMPMLDQSNKAPIQASNLPHRNITPPSSVGNSQPLPQTLHSMAGPSTVTTTPAAPTFIPNPNSTGKEVDPSKIVALKIIISDEQEEPSSDSALNQAVSSITGDRIPTIFLSSPTKSPAKAPALSGAPMAQEETVQAVSSLQRTEVLLPAETNPLSGKAGDVAALAGTSSALTQPGYYIQLPFDSATSTNSYILVTDTTATDPQSNKVILPSGAPQVQTVPPTSYTLATPPCYSPGSRLIISSPVQPMLQSMVVPVSVVGQNNATQFSVVPNQLIAMPSPASAKQPAAVNTDPKLAPKDTTVSGKTGASGSNIVTKQVHPQSSESTGQQKVVAVGSSPSHRRMLCFDGSAGETSTSKATATAVSPVQQVEKEMPKSASAILGSSRPKRRIETVRCTDNTQTSWTGTETEKSSTVQKQKEAAKKTPSKRDANQNARSQSASTSRSQSAGSSRTEASQSESRKRSQSADKKKDDDGAGPKDAQSSRSSSSDHRLRSGSRKEKDSYRQEPTEKSPAKEREGRTEKRTSSQDPPHVTANKENELEGGRREQQPTPAPRAFSPAPQTPVPQACSSKFPSKTSPLTKQAAEMLHNIQGLNPPSTPPKKPGMGCLELPLPRTPGRLHESLYCPRTPARQKLDRNGEGTTRHLVPPTTPDLPSCSPASEAGSENSINMAAHTLMILSRAAIARTGTPLKDSLRQEGAGAVTPVAFKSKKRKQPGPLASPPAKKDLSGSSGSKKKAKKQQKLMDSFPDDLDVDKFLSSLHYDE